MKSPISKKLFSFFLCLLVVSNGYAKPLLDIVISEGQFRGIPIAVVPFQMGGDIAKDSLEDISTIIHNNLRSSGQFNPIPSWEIEQFPSAQGEVDADHWLGLGAEHILVGQVERTGNDKYLVVFQLLDLFQQKQSDGISAPPLITMQFFNVQPEEFRVLAHHISDTVFEKLIGVKGVFATRIAYISVLRSGSMVTHRLMVADSDGFDVTPIVTSSYPLMSPAWSPDGKKIAYVTFEGNRSAVNVIEVASGEVTQISRYPGINGGPAWSPDGKQLAVVLSKTGAPKLFTYHTESKKFTQITFGSSLDAEPCWMPDGKSIVFASNRGGKPQVYQVILASGKVQRLTYEGNYNVRPRVTPDGKHMVMMHRGDDKVFSIAVQSLNSGDLRVLTHATLDESPSVAPNGMMVLYGSLVDGKGVLGAVSLDGRFKMRLPSQAGNVQEPAWSPFLSS